MLRSIELVRGEVPSLTINNDFNKPVKIRMSNLNMLTQVRHGKFKPKFMKDQCIGTSHRLPNYKKWSTQELTYQCYHFSYISQHPNLYICKNQQWIRSQLDSSYQRVPKTIHIIWFEYFSMRHYCSRLRTSYQPNCHQPDLINYFYK